MRLVGYKKVLSKDKTRLIGYGLNFTYEDSKLDEGIAVAYEYVGIDVLSDVELIIYGEYEVYFDQFHHVKNIKLVG